MFVNINVSDGLADHFLIATDQLANSGFAGSVIFICDHDRNGAMGIVVNHVSKVKYEELIQKLNITPSSQETSERTIHWGGPIQIERGFVLHTHDGTTYRSALHTKGGLCLTTSIDVIESMCAGKGPSQSLITLGYAGWSAGQLEDEIRRQDWVVIPADHDIIFSTPVYERHRKALAKVYGQRRSFPVISPSSGWA